MTTFSSLLAQIAKGPYQRLPTIAFAAALSQGLSYAVNRYRPLTIPQNAAIFTACAMMAKQAAEQFHTEFKTSSASSSTKQRDRLSQFSLISLAAYGINAVTNQETIFSASFVKLCLQAVACSFITGRIVPKVSHCRVKTPSTNEQTFNMLRSAYKNLYLTAAATGLAGLVTHVVHHIGLDPKKTMFFTATASVLYYVTRPLLTTLDSEYVYNTAHCETFYTTSRAIVLLGLTKMSADALKLELPLYKEFAKACALATLLIRGLEYFAGTKFSPESLMSLHYDELSDEKIEETNRHQAPVHERGNNKTGREGTMSVPRGGKSGNSDWGRNRFLDSSNGRSSNRTDDGFPYPEILSTPPEDHGSEGETEAL